MSLLSFFVCYHPVSVAPHCGCHTLICHQSHVSLLPPLPRCLYIVVYLSFHVLHFGLFSLYRDFPERYTRQHTKFSTFWASCFIHVCLLLYVTNSCSVHTWSCFISYVFLCLLFRPLLSSSLLLNIWLWARWHDTTVPHWSWGCLDLKAEDKERYMRHFQTHIWAFSESHNLVVQFRHSGSKTFCWIMSRRARSKEHTWKDFKQGHYIWGEYLLI